MIGILKYNLAGIEALAKGNDPEAWKRFRDEYNAFRDAVTKITDERTIRLREEQRKEHRKQLKALSKDTIVYYTYNSSQISYGSECIKVKDGIKYMTCRYNNTLWNLSYTHLSAVSPSESQVKVNRGIAGLLKD